MAFDDAYLEHFGILGMKWGRRKAAIPGPTGIREGLAQDKARINNVQNALATDKQLRAPKSSRREQKIAKLEAKLAKVKTRHMDGFAQDVGNRTWKRVAMSSFMGATAYSVAARAQYAGGALLEGLGPNAGARQLGTLIKATPGIGGAAAGLGVGMLTNRALIKRNQDSVIKTKIGKLRRKG